VSYELYLRYYVRALRYAGFPHAFQTVGSCMAVRCRAYQKVGGMNRRQGGEDFYFLSKIIALGGFTELRDTTVCPSSRVSHRVPFGTGRAMEEWTEGGHHTRLVYPLAAFDSLRSLCTKVTELRVLPSSHAGELEWLCPRLAHYLDENGFLERLEEIRAKTATRATFERRFYQWFNGFRVVKFLNWLREQGQIQVPIEEAAAQLLCRAGELERATNPSTEKLLQHYRRLDREGRELEFVQRTSRLHDRHS